MSFKTRISSTMSAAMVAAPIADTVQMRRLVGFASDVTRLAAKRRDLDLRAPVDDLHADVLRFAELYLVLEFGHTTLSRHSDDLHVAGLGCGARCALASDPDPHSRVQTSPRDPAFTC